MYYFAYSLNLNKKKMAETCPQSRPLYIATLHNYRLLFTGWTRQWHGGVATIQRSTGDKVLGAIYDVPDAEWGRLDKSEDCSGNFERIRVIVNNEDFFGHVPFPPLQDQFAFCGIARTSRVPCGFSNDSA